MTNIALLVVCLCVAVALGRRYLRSVAGDTGANSFVQSVALPAPLLLQMHDAHLRREGV
jgi:hypothetical protein